MLFNKSFSSRWSSRNVLAPAYWQGYAPVQNVSNCSSSFGKGYTWVEFYFLAGNPSLKSCIEQLLSLCSIDSDMEVGRMQFRYFAGACKVLCYGTSLVHLATNNGHRDFHNIVSKSDLEQNIINIDRECRVLSLLVRKCLTFDTTKKMQGAHSFIFRCHSPTRQFNISELCILVLQAWKCKIDNNLQPKLCCWYNWEGVGDGVRLLKAKNAHDRRNSSPCPKIVGIPDLVQLCGKYLWM